ncbi:hypothetical protein ABK040_011253 [Willaertia magna]
MSESDKPVIEGKQSTGVGKHLFRRMSIKQMPSSSTRNSNKIFYENTVLEESSPVNRNAVYGIMDSVMRSNAGYSDNPYKYNNSSEF